MRKMKEIEVSAAQGKATAMLKGRFAELGFLIFPLNEGRRRNENDYVALHKVDENASSSCDRRKLAACRFVFPSAHRRRSVR